MIYHNNNNNNNTFNYNDVMTFIYNTSQYGTTAGTTAARLGLRYTFVLQYQYERIH